MRIYNLNGKKFSILYVPWINWDEWEYTMGLLWSEVSSNRAAGVAQVSAWRCRTSVHCAIVSTAQLVDLLLWEENPRSYKSCSISRIRHVYCSVITRALDGIVQEYEGQVGYSEDIFSDRLGIPMWIVELRHAAVHREMPSLSSLRLAASILLEYLKKNYWDKQYICIQNLSSSLTKVSEGSYRSQVWDISKALTSLEAAKSFVSYISSPEILTKILTCDFRDVLNSSMITVMRPKLQELQNRWPEFPRMVLEIVIDSFMLSTALLNDDGHCTDRIDYFSAWIEYFLSNNWKVPPIEGIQAKSKKRRRLDMKETSTDNDIIFMLMQRCINCGNHAGAMATASILQKYALSPDKLCDEPAAKKSDILKPSLGLEDFENLLNDDVYMQQCTNSGGHAGKMVTLSTRQKYDLPSDKSYDKLAAKKSNDILELPLSLEGFEDLLNDDDTFSINHVSNSNDATKNIDEENDLWNICEDWDPCPIGSLPGQTMLFEAKNL